MTMRNRAARFLMRRSWMAINVLVAVSLVVESAALAFTPQSVSLGSALAQSAQFSLALDGSTGFADAQPSADLNPTGDWTVELWFKDLDPNGFLHELRSLLDKGDGVAPESPYFVLLGNGNLLVGLRSAGVNHAITFNLQFYGYSPKIWQRVSAAYTAGDTTLTLYLNGAQVAQQNLGAQSTGNNLPLEIGREGPATGKYWLGKIDDLRIWNVARGAGDIQANYLTEFSSPQPGLIANWRFNEGSGTTAFDLEGTHDATLEGGASFSADEPPSPKEGSPTPTPTATSAAAATSTPTATPTNTAVPTNTPLPTATPTNTAVPTDTPTPTPTPTNTPLPTATPTNTLLPTATPTNTAVPTDTPTPTPTPTNTPLPTATPTNTPLPTATPTNTPLPTATPTNTALPTATPTNTAVPTDTPTPTVTPTNTPLPTNTPTNTPLPTATPTNTPLPTNTPTNTPLPTATPTNTPLPTATPTNTPLPTNTPTVTPTATNTAPLTNTPTATPTSSPTPTTTPTPAGTPPVASISAPADGSQVTTLTNVVGTASSSTLSSFVLAYAPTGANQAFTQFASGTASVTNGTLGTFDPTVLMDGQYVIRLTATDTSGRSSLASVSVVVSGNQKVGAFSMSFVDFDLPFSGLPVQVIRTYDSRDKSNGDFGVGWALSLRDVRVQKNRPEGQSWQGTVSGGVLPTYCDVPAATHVVTITLPDGSVHNFDAIITNPPGGCQQIQPPDQVVMGFQAEPGTTSTLETLDDNTALAPGPWPGQFDLLDISTVSAKDFQNYRLTLSDGRQLVMNINTGLQSVTDRNGNTLTFTNSGITSSPSGKSLTFTRDGQNRITQITDPSGHTRTYSYTSTGDLNTSTDQLNQATTYSYNNTHGLLGLTNPGQTQPVVRNDYDSSGRLISHTDANGKTVTYTHLTNQHEEQVTDRNGGITLYTYDDQGNVVSEQDPTGAVTTNTFDANNNRTSTTDALGHKTILTYDSQNNLLSTTDAAGNTTSYTYNGNGQVLNARDGRGNSVTNTYDATSGNVTSTRDVGGNVTNYAYDSAGRITSITDPLNNVRHFAYDSTGNLQSMTDPLGHVTTYTYDTNGNKLTESRTRTISTGTETLVTSFQYDALNRLIQTIFPDGSTTKTAYNSVGNIASITDQLNRVTAYDYDPMGRKIATHYPDGTSESSTFDGNGNELTSTDRGGRTTTKLYDAAGRLVKTTNPDSTTYVTNYDAAGRIASIVDERGATTTYGYDNAGRRTSLTDPLNHTTNFTFDGNANQTSIKDANNNTTSFQYDANNRLIGTTYPDSRSDSTAYDALGRIISKTDAAGQKTTYTYDALARILSVTDALNHTTSYTYDELGKRVTQTDANSHTTHYQYDRVGNRTSRSLPSGIGESFAYDAFGNQVSHTNFNGTKTTMAYDAANRLLSKTPDPSLGQPAVSFTYTAAGQRASMMDAIGVTSYTYDSRDRLLRKAAPFGTLTYTYEPGGAIASLQSSNVNGASANYAYDALGRLTTVVDNRLPAGSNTTTYTYDAVGNLGGYTYPNGVHSAYAYDGRNRLTNETVSHSGVNLAGYTYSLGPASNRLSVSELGGRQVAWSYDSVYRLTNETIAGDPALGANGSISYTYDNVGNRQSRTSTVATVPAATSTYDVNDQLVGDTYDAEGNTIASGGNTYTYDFEDRLTRLNSGAVVVAYDGEGNRLQRTVAGVTTSYLVDDRNPTGFPQVVDELSSGVVQRTYTYGLSRVSETQPLGTSFYSYDGQGSTRVLTNSSGAVTDTYSYDAFGNVTARTGTTANNYMFDAEQFDADLSLYYLRARYYRQGVGRFMTADTYEGKATEPATLHRYTYVANDPVNKVDPSGHQFSMAEVSISIDISISLDAIQGIYYKRLFKFAISALRCIFCLINPGYQLQEQAMDMMFGDDFDIGYAAWQHGQDMIVQGYQALGKAIGDFYMNLAIDSVLKGLTINITTTQVLITERIFLYISRSATYKPDKLWKLYKRLDKSKSFIQHFFTDEGGAACKLLWIAELAAAFV